MSLEQIFETSEAPHVVIRLVRSALTVRGWSEPRVAVRAEGERCRCRQEGDRVVIDEVDNGSVRLPQGARLTVELIQGHAQIRTVGGEVVIARVQGNLVLAEVGPVQLGPVDGNVAADDVAGTLAAGRVAGNLALSAVHGPVTLEGVSGNCRARDLADLVVERVRGNLVVRDGGTVTAGHVDGDLVVRALRGAVKVGQVSGSAQIADVDQEVICESVGGDLRVRGRVLSLTGRAGGSAKLRFGPDAPRRLLVTAGGDIRCRIPTATQAKVLLRGGDEVRVRDLPVNGEWDRTQTEFVLGTGEGQIELTAGGSVRLSGDDEPIGPDELNVEIDAQLQQELSEHAGDLIRQVSEQVEAHVESLTRQLDERLARFGSGDEVAAKVQQKIQAAVRLAEEKLAETARRMEQQAAREAVRQDRRYDRRTQGGPPPVPPVPPVPPPPAPPRPKRNPPTDEERMLILRMVEQGKLSVEQAEKLLAAME